MKVRYEVEKKCEYGELTSGDIFLLYGSWYIKTDHDTAVDIDNGREVCLDDSCQVGVPNNAELVIM